MKVYQSVIEARNDEYLDDNIIHKLTLTGFQHLPVPEGSTLRQEAGMLYRLNREEPVIRNGAFIRPGQTKAIIVQSVAKPRWENAAPASRLGKVRAVNEVDISFSEGDTIAYQALLAAIRVGEIPPGMKRGRVHPITNREDALDWWINKSRLIGIELDQNQLTADSHFVALSIKSRGGQDGPPARNFYGIARVTDPQRFEEVCIKGLGKGRSFGAGLILTKKV